MVFIFADNHVMPTIPLLAEGDQNTTDAVTGRGKLTNLRLTIMVVVLSAVALIFVIICIAGVGYGVCRFSVLKTENQAGEKLYIEYIIIHQKCI